MQQHCNSNSMQPKMQQILYYWHSNSPVSGDPETNPSLFFTKSIYTVVCLRPRCFNPVRTNRPNKSIHVIILGFILAHCYLFVFSIRLAINIQRFWSEMAKHSQFPQFFHNFQFNFLWMKNEFKITFEIVAIACHRCCCRMLPFENFCQ